MRLRGKVALVTGGAGGIGAAIAERYVAEGARVIVADRSLAAAEAVAARLGPAAFGFAVDVASIPAVEALLEAAESRVGPLDILVNNAAVYDLQPLLAVDPDSFDRLFAINVRGLFFTMQAAARRMVAAGRRGAIINMASQAGRRGEAQSAVYAATKATVISLTQSAALALVKDGVRVNAIAPGVIDTPMWDHVDALHAKLDGLPVGEKKRQVGAAVPYGRMGVAREIAGAAVFLASDDAEYVVGQTLNVDGGNVLS
ncbi:L-iditol 2-dehydrogenase [Lichenibacterium ramalinae]|uniref:L-iditol 2-dehydrogenase n=1 Tax=Lichenibacterium ramalinae TaxID=2316527 RepID=A0A4Q2RF49_9HYPH|nr:L-iditol 2-dehydrogenase [Lichenibacterium ramalinae]RYB05921.1 L-iditol 2-dehydrogenase [Lichenibacterium ramalinae]